MYQFNARGLAFLEDASRSGRPLHYDQQRGHWTLDRLVEYVNMVLSIPISRSQLADVLTQEGLK